MLRTLSRTHRYRAIHYPELVDLDLQGKRAFVLGLVVIFGAKVFASGAQGCDDAAVWG